MPGPRPTPLRILADRGSRRAERNRDEPQAELGKPEVEFHDETESKAVFDRLCELLDSMRLLHRTDAYPIERYCRMLVRWRRAEQFLEKYGESYPTKDKNGNVTSFQQFPQVAIARTLSLALTKMEAEFGLTPSARSRIMVETQQRTAIPVRKRG